MAGAPSASSTKGAEALWKHRVDVARERYGLAVAHFNRVLSKQNAGLLMPPDGSFAVRDARLKESMARSEYMRALRIFTDLILHEKLPPSE